MKDGVGEGLKAFFAGLEGVSLDVGEMEGALEVVGAKTAFELIGFDIVPPVHYS